LFVATFRALPPAHGDVFRDERRAVAGDGG
jgi:hypothetical protein